MSKYAIITGPTTSGKSTLAHDLFDKIPCSTIINADSRQFYKYFSIGTAKPSSLEIKDYNYKLIDFLDPQKQFNAYQFQQETEKILKTNNRSLVVGGSPFYIDSLLNQIPYHDPIPLENQKKIETLFLEKGINFLQEELKKKDFEYYQEVDKNNHKRLIRALTYITTFNSKYSKFRKKKIFQKSKPLIFILYPPKHILHQNIDMRTHEMIQSGLIEEVESLLQNGIKENYPAFNSIGYKETLEFLQGKITRTQMIENIKLNTRRFAKKQLTWFNKFQNVVFVLYKENFNESLFKELPYISLDNLDLLKNKINFKLCYNDLKNMVAILKRYYHEK